MNRFIEGQADQWKLTYLKKPTATAYRCVPATFFILVLLLSVANTTLGNWVSFRGNAQLTGVADSELPDDPQLLWTFQAGDMIESTAAVVDGMVYVGALNGC